MNILIGIDKNLIFEIIKLTYPNFKKHVSLYNFISIILSSTNWEKSIMLIDDNNKIKGVYLLGDAQINIPKYDKFNGVEGVLLFVSEDIRGNGWGNKLKDHPKLMGYDYIWGIQLKSLNNLNHWLKRRKLISDNGFSYLTLEFFDK